MKDSKVYIIVAVEHNTGIGKNGKMPWDLKSDMKHFREKTVSTIDSEKRNAVIMGSVTWESLPEKFRPLPNRKNIVLTRNSEFDAKNDDVLVKNSLPEAISDLKEDKDIENIFIIGGASIYRQSVDMPEVDGIYITIIENSYDCDTFFPQVPGRFNKETLLKEEEENGTKIKFYLYEKE
ncbi:MAG: dihydrofolate reductase [Candidatus Gracilibacteria bacterium]|nr:dihydrofolate reductase [Candidatus Gracilibacteria bacterium]